ncbi:hypothetical protein IKQ21_06305 [bacterium]|nr:hypothetical protein [bacterium]
MERFKKRTLALVLASVITVVGTCGAEHYKNSLMSLELNGSTDNSVNVILHTKISDNTPVIPKKTDANTYIIMLPETDGKNASSPKLTNNVESINIRTMPYTTNGNGYTKITIKTSSPSIKLNAEKTLFIATDSNLDKSDDSNYNYSYTTDEGTPQTTSDSTNTANKQKKREQQSSGTQFNPPAQQTPSTQQENATDNSGTPITEDNTLPDNTATATAATDENSTDDTLLWIFGVLTVITICIFIYIKGKNKMNEIVGESIDFSAKDEENNQKPTKRKQIKNTINALNKMYEKPIKMPTPKDTVVNKPEDENQETVSEENVIVDLDELFQANNKLNGEQKNTSEEESEEHDNLALDDFLSTFNFDEEDIAQKEIDANNYMQELYEKYILNGTFTFTQSDINKINDLLNSEISDETLNNISQYAVSNPIKPKKTSKYEVLEDLITNYTINQNLSFSKDDVDALNKLINVEIDTNFVKDLTTNPERTMQMQKEIESRQVSHKTHEILTLNVKDMLPDLSEALKQQGNKKIEYEVKPQVVYYNDSYEVSKLNVHEELPDLTLDFDNPEFNKYRPSDTVELVAKGYDVQTLNIEESLPDLKDAMNHPEKYNTPKPAAVADEDSLLKSITNVTFKPFYDGEETFDIINKFENDDDMFGTPAKEDSSENSIDAETGTEITDENDKQPMELLKLNKTVHHVSKENKKDSKTSELLQVIENQQKQRIQKVESKQKIETSAEKHKESDKIDQRIRTCSVEGETFDILNTAEINENTGCHLCKNDTGYAVICYIRRKLQVVKRYDKLNSQRIQARLNEKLENGITQYIIRIGTNKFIVNISDNSMEYIMDLC